jgi:hypothetical protein
MHETYCKHKNHYQGLWQLRKLTFQPSIKNMNMNKDIEYEKMYLLNEILSITWKNLKHEMKWMLKTMLKSHISKYFV